jgi:hypothetical protein
MAGRIAGQGSNWIRKDKRLAIYMRDGCACVYCGIGLEAGAELTLDHVLACELGGTNHQSNLVTACINCNSAKQDLPLADWFATLRDRGVDTSGMGAFIRETTARKLDRKTAKRMLRNRRNGARVESVVPR